MCDSGHPRDLFFDDLENPASGNWTTQTLYGANHWHYPQNSHDYGPGYDMTYARSGRYNLWGDNVGNDIFGGGDKAADFAI